MVELVVRKQKSKDSKAYGWIKACYEWEYWGVDSLEYERDKESSLQSSVDSL